MNVRIIAKKAYEFKTDDTPDKVLKVKVDPFVVTSVPDWVIKTDLFKLAQKSGNVELMSDITQEMSLSEIEELQELAKFYNIKNYKNMKLATLKEKVADAKAKAEEQTTNGVHSGEPPEYENDTEEEQN